MTTIAAYGVPGVGKTWAVYRFLKEVGFGESKKIGLVLYHDLGNTAVVGLYNGEKFQGTDKMSMAVAPSFAEFFSVMKAQGKQLIIGEGDRVNNWPFLDNANKNGKIERIRVTCDMQTLQIQRTQRSHEFSDKFLKVVQSKVDKHNYDRMLTSENLKNYLIQKWQQLTYENVI